MLPDRVSNPGPLTYESGALPIALRSPALAFAICNLQLVSVTVRACMIVCIECLKYWYTRKCLYGYLQMHAYV